MNESKKTKFKVGQTVWDIRNGRGVVIDIEPVGTYPINVKYDLKDKHGCEIYDSFTLDGRWSENQKVRSLYFSEPKIIAEIEPPFEPKLKKGDKILAVYKRSGETEISDVEYEDESHVWLPCGSGYIKNCWRFYKLPEVQLITFD